MKAKIDLFKEHKAEYATPRKPVLIETTPGRYLSISGRGVPGGEEFQTALGALYGMAYTLKFESKGAGRDYKVAPLEGLWWGARKKPKDPQAFATEPPETWKYEMLIRTPDFVTDEQRKRAAGTLLEKGKGPEVKKVVLRDLHEGRCVQVLHVGPYDAEGPTIEAMLAFAEERGLGPAGLHHEIYLSDPRRVPPERLRTILRFPVG
jgi:hypothetical protein